MNRLIKYTCTNSTYINNKEPDTIFYNNEYLLAGLQKEQKHKPEINISLFNFPPLKINYDNIINAHLFINLKDTELHTNPYNNKLHILGNYDYLNFSELTYNNFKISELCGECYEKINLISNSLIDIDITNVIKDLSKYGFNTNIFLIPDNECYFCFNIDPKHIPYISIEIAENAEIINSEINIDTPEKISFKKTTSDTIHKKSIYKFISNISENLLNLSETVNKINKRLAAIEDAADRYEITLNKKIEDFLALITSNNSNSISEYSNKLDDFLQNNTAALSYLNMQFNNLSEYIREDSANTNSSLTKSIKKIDEIFFNHNKLDSYLKDQLKNLNNNYTNIYDSLSNIASNISSYSISSKNTSDILINNIKEFSSFMASSNNKILEKTDTLEFSLENITEVTSEFASKYTNMSTTINNYANDLKSAIENISTVSTQLASNFNSLEKSAQKNNTVLNNSLKEYGTVLDNILKSNSEFYSNFSDEIKTLSLTTNDINHKLCNLDDINDILASLDEFNTKLSQLNKCLSDKNTPLKFDSENNEEMKNINDQLLELNTLVSKLIDDFNTITIEPFIK